MAKIGERAELRILREKPVGLFLEAGDLGEVLLPRREMPVEWCLGGTVDVFLYLDSEDRPVATLKKPLAMPGEFARLKVVAVNAVGAFLDWGLPKDLMVPFREQKVRMEVGKSYIVRVSIDEPSGRIVASPKVARFLGKSPRLFQPGEAVDLMLYGKTSLGYKAIIDNSHEGLLFANDVYQELQPGERMKGYIAEVREDGKIDLTLHPPGRQRVTDLESRILAELEARGGFWGISDHSSAEEINEELGVSKRTFKQTLGALLKGGKIQIGPTGIRLV